MRIMVKSRIRKVHAEARSARIKWTWVLAVIGAILALSPALRAADNCPVEVKLLLSPQTIQAVITAFGFEGQTSGHVYFFDTNSLALLNQGVILRVRQGARNDLTVKIRRPADEHQLDTSYPTRYRCEIDRTQAGADISYTAEEKYKRANVPKTGEDIYNLLGSSQVGLLREAQIAIDWTQVRNVVGISFTKWEAPADSPSGELALELWVWPGGKILELSAKTGPGSGASRIAELERLVKMKNLSLSASQVTKTSFVLNTVVSNGMPK
jgi:hypothetical protein